MSAKRVKIFFVVISKKYGLKKFIEQKSDFCSVLSAIEETSATPNSKTPTSVVAQLPCASVARL
jgi:hypothetical protein